MGDKALLLASRSCVMTCNSSLEIESVITGLNMESDHLLSIFTPSTSVEKSRRSRGELYNFMCHLVVFSLIHLLLNLYV